MSFKHKSTDTGLADVRLPARRCLVCGVSRPLEHLAASVCINAAHCLALRLAGEASQKVSPRSAVRASGRTFTQEHDK